MERDRLSPGGYFAQRLRRLVRGTVLSDRAALASYAPEAGAWPACVILQPADEGDVLAALSLAGTAGVKVRARGAGTGPRAGTPVVGGAQSATKGAGGAATDGPVLLVIDAARHLDAVVAIDVRAARVEVQPGLTLEQLDAWLAPQGLWWPLDLPGARTATLGGMVAGHAIGPRALGFGTLRHRVQGLDVLLADGTPEHFGPFGVGATRPMASARTGRLVSQLFEWAQQERAAIVAASAGGHRATGYAWDVFAPSGSRSYTPDGSVNLAHLLVGSQGSLAWLARLHLRAAARPAWRYTVRGRVTGLDVALGLAETLVDHGPWAVGLREERPGGAVEIIAEFGQRTGAVGAAGAMNAVSGVDRVGAVDRTDDPDGAGRSIEAVRRLLANAGVTGIGVIADEDAQTAHWARVTGAKPGAGILGRVVLPRGIAGGPGAWLRAAGEALAAQGLMAGWAGYLAPDDWILCAGLPEGGQGSHGGEGRSDHAAAWATVLDRLAAGIEAPEAGLVGRLAALDERLRAAFDPGARFVGGLPAAGLPWSGVSALPSAAVSGGASAPASPGVASAVVRGRPVPVLGLSRMPADWRADLSRCDQAGRCRSLAEGAMCPSFRISGDEREAPRGRVAALRALPDAQGADARALERQMLTCVGCQACRSECPQQIDLSRAKQAVDAGRHAHGRVSRAGRLAADLPRLAARFGAWSAGLNRLMDSRLGAIALRRAGFSLDPPLPRWARRSFLRGRARVASTGPLPPVLLWADTLNNHFEPQALEAAWQVLARAGYRVEAAGAGSASGTGAPLCCGRSHLAAGQSEAARRQLARTVAALLPAIRAGATLVVLEPACLTSLRESALDPGLGLTPELIEGARALAGASLGFEAFLMREHRAGRLALDLGPLPGAALYYPHCHQRAAGTTDDALEILDWIPGLSITALDAPCCGMAGAFGLLQETADAGRRMAGLGLLPAMAAAPADAWVVADGASCRHRIRHDGGREPIHLAQLLLAALDARGARDAAGVDLQNAGPTPGDAGVMPGDAGVAAPP